MQATALTVDVWDAKDHEQAGGPSRATKTLQVDGALPAGVDQDALQTVVSKLNRQCWEVLSSKPGSTKSGLVVEGIKLDPSTRQVAMEFIVSPPMKEGVEDDTETVTYTEEL